VPVLRSLRLVEMQLTATAATLEYEESPTSAANPPAAEMTVALAEYETRRCVVCSCRHASFGFGPPLHCKGTIWACGTHRGEVDRQLRNTGSFSREATDPTAVGPPAPRVTSVRNERADVLQPSLF